MTLSPEMPVAAAPNRIVGAEHPSGQIATSRPRTAGGPQLADRRSSRFVLGDLSAEDRDRVAEILRATRVFRASEISIALELFDEGTRDSGMGNRESGIDWPRAVPSSESRVPSPDYMLLGAFAPGAGLAGYACYGATPGTDRTFDLYWIAVHPALQGAGIGTILIDEVERRLEGLHARMLVVETSSRSDYAPTRDFYRRRGYSEVARVREFYAAGDDRIIFTKRFHSPTGRGA